MGGGLFVGHSVPMQSPFIRLKLERITLNSGALVGPIFDRRNMKVVTVVERSGREVEFEDDPATFPSDKLITELALLYG